MKNGLISIIVPVYNAETCIDACVNSILSQTYKNIEIILVNDGSTDGSGAICDALAQNDSRIHVLHKANGGAPSARNAGMDAAQGEFLGFVDSDDTIDAEMYEHMFKRINKTGADICICGFKYCLVNEDITLHNHVPGELTLSPAQLWEEYINNMSKYRVIVHTAPWNKLVRSSLLDGNDCSHSGKLRQQEEPRRTKDERGLVDSGTAFCADLFQIATNGITFVDITPYNYLIRYTSNMSAVNEITHNVMLHHMHASMMSTIPHMNQQIERTLKIIKCMILVGQAHEAMMRKLPKPKLLRFRSLATILLHHPNLMPKLQALLVYFLPSKLYLPAFKRYCKYASRKHTSKP